MMELVLLRHGESRWNRENRFTGWEDVALSEQGIAEATSAGSLLVKQGYAFDIVYTSVLKRAIKTTWLVLEHMDLQWVPVMKSWRLNERHYGALQGRDKKETVRVHGDEQVHRWRRGYSERPPSLTPDDGRWPGNDERYRHLYIDLIPCAESLEDTVQRLIPYWHEMIVPDLQRGRRVLVSAHGNSLRALVSYLEDLPVEDILNLEIPTAVPLIYKLDDALLPRDSFYLKKDGSSGDAAEK